MTVEDTSEIFSEEPLERLKALSNVTPVATGGRRVFLLYSATRLGRRVALKCLSAEARGNELYEQMLFKEFEIGATIEHANVAAATDIITDPALGPCIVRQWVAGKPLGELMAEGGLGRDAAVEIARQIASGLAYLHGRGIVHRDIKPANIIVNPDTDAVKIIDLGCGDSADFDILKMPMGTRGYAGPGHMAGEADPRADLYSLGVVFGELSEAAGGVRVLARLSKRLMLGRIDSIEEVERALRPRHRVWPVIVLAAGTALAGVGMGLSLGSEDARPAIVDTVYVEPDTVYVEPDTVYVDAEMPAHIPTEPVLDEVTGHVTDMTRRRLERENRLALEGRAYDQNYAHNLMNEAEAYAAKAAGANASLRVQLVAVAREAAAAEMRRFNATHKWVPETKIPAGPQPNGDSDVE